jgi:hypothetical protein
MLTLHLGTSHWVKQQQGLAVTCEFHHVEVASRVCSPQV